MLESFVSNWMSPEQQMMNRFILYQQTTGASCLDAIGESFPELHKLCSESHSTGALQYYLNDGSTSVSYSQNALCHNACEIDATLQPFHEISTTRQFEKYFSDFDLQCLREVYSRLYPEEGCRFTFVSRKHLVLDSVTVFGERFLSKRSRSQRSLAVLANWRSSGSDICTNKEFYTVGEIQYYFTHVIELTTNALKMRKVEHIFALVKWYQNSPRPKFFGYPLLVVSTIFESDGSASIIPFSRILCRCGISKELSVTFDYGEDTVLIVCPYFQNQIISPQQWTLSDARQQ